MLLLYKLVKKEEKNDMRFSSNQAANLEDQFNILGVEQQDFSPALPQILRQL